MSCVIEPEFDMSRDRRNHAPGLLAVRAISVAGVVEPMTTLLPVSQCDGVIELN